MLVEHSADAKADIPHAAIKRATDAVSRSLLREIVDVVAIPRHYELEPENNRLTGHWIARQLRSYGYQTHFHGEYANVVALAPGNPVGAASQSLILVGAHYDSVPGCPGADDNASAVAAMLACAKVLAEHAPESPVCYVSFNREEDGLLGSADFVERIVAGKSLVVREAHILEMVGCCDHRPASQSIPTGLPIQIPYRGDFLGILANEESTAIASGILRTAKTYRPDFPVLSLKVYGGIGKLVPVLGRSDHVPFWRADIPAVMWTDTSEFRNHHYHRETDTPDTLDYDFLSAVTQILIATVLDSVKKRSAPAE